MYRTVNETKPEIINYVSSCADQLSQEDILTLANLIKDYIYNADNTNQEAVIRLFISLLENISPIVYETIYTILEALGSGKYNNNIESVSDIIKQINTP